MTEAMVQRLKDGLGVSAAQMYPDRRHARPGRRQAASPTSTGPTCGSSRGCRSRGRGWRPADGRTDLFARDRARRTCSCTCPTTPSRPASRRSSGRAPKDRDVVGLKTTVYRTSDDSALLPALIEAAEEGKQSVCLVELKARFDERRNIAWSRAMERAGVHVVLRLREPQDPRQDDAGRAPRGRLAAPLRRTSAPATTTRVTARLYEDFGLFTAGRGDHRRHRRPVQPPDRIRAAAASSARSWPRRSTCAAALTERIRAVARRRRRGERARIRLKVNALADPGDHRRAVQGVGRPGADDRARRARRSACCGRACPGCSESITVRSVVGRFLEHSRVYRLRGGRRRRRT